MVVFVYSWLMFDENRRKPTKYTNSQCVCLLLPRSQWRFRLILQLLTDVGQLLIHGPEETTQGDFYSLKSLYSQMFEILNRPEVARWCVCLRVCVFQ